MNRRRFFSFSLLLPRRPTAPSAQPAPQPKGPLFRWGVDDYMKTAPFQLQHPMTVRWMGSPVRWEPLS